MLQKIALEGLNMCKINSQNSTIITLVLALFAPCIAFSECVEYKIIDYGDHVEAVCVGAPLSDAQKKELEKKNIQEQKAIMETGTQNQNNGNYDNRRLYRGVAPSQQYPNQVTTGTTTSTAEIPEVSNVEVKSYDIKYIPSNLPTFNGRQQRGEYSIKIDAKNTGRRGTINFKLKQTDFSGYETESMMFSEHFEKDQQKIVTTHQPASQVPFVQSRDWIIEAYKY
jgi:hypothetical protein